MRSPRLAIGVRLVIGGVVAVVLIAAPVARAGFTPATFVSGGPTIPFEEAGSPALSQDGRYVVFQGRIVGDPGVYRRDLQTGAVEAVAAGVDPVWNPVSSSFAAPDAAAPSVSADGRYVAFTSAAPLDPQAEIPAVDAHCPQVYVRDMTLPPEAPGAYVLASAVGGSGGEPLRAFTYTRPCPAPPGHEFLVDGAQAASGAALSADGEKVAFTLLSPSSRYGEGANVLVRDLATDETTLVSEAFDSAGDPAGAPPAGGGAFPSSTSEPLLGSPGIEPFLGGDQPTISSASISADGSTVAWIGTDVPAQVPSAGDVTAGTAHLGGEAREVEPLWRRLGEGGSAVTKRLLGQAGLNLFFTLNHENGGGNAVEAGTLFTQDPASFLPPALSADGDLVATVAAAPTAANEASYAVSSYPAIPTDAYLIEVDGDPASAPQVTPLTATPSFAVSPSLLHGVTHVTISPDGSRVAFDTARTKFALATPTLISPSVLESPYAYIYEASLALGTLQRVTTPLGEAAPNGQPGAISFSGDDATLAFASGASNLIFGTPTTDVSQVYVAHELPNPSAIAAQSVSPAPEVELPTPDWVLTATATRQRDGSVLVHAEVPGAGRLAATLTAQLPTAGAAARGRRSRGRRASSIPRATLARASSSAATAASLQVRLTPSSRYRKLLQNPLGIYCLARVTFAAPGRPQLSRVIPVTVHVRPARVRRVRRGSRRRDHRTAA